jgi:choline dehydrogenase-like flavoprotein
MPENNFDAIVIGSGTTGGLAAKKLTEKGLKVMMLERGQNIEHIKDYVKTNRHPREFAHRGSPTRQMKEELPVIKRDYPPE